MVLVRKNKDKISNEWMIQLYFASLRSESEVQKVVGLPHVSIQIIFLSIKVIKYIYIF